MSIINVPNILEDLKKKVESGELSIREAAEGLHEAGWTNFIDEAKTRRLLGLSAASNANKIMEFMRNNGLHGEVWDEKEDVVAVEITWGDWKHQHAYLDYLVKELMPELKKVESVVTEEDGSDCYSAIHKFYF